MTGGFGRGTNGGTRPPPPSRQRHVKPLSAGGGADATGSNCAQWDPGDNTPACPQQVQLYFGTHIAFGAQAPWEPTFLRSFLHLVLPLCPASPYLHFSRVVGDSTKK